MDIEYQLRYHYSKNTIIKIAEYFNNNPREIKFGIKLLTGKDFILSQRIAWSVGYLDKRCFNALEKSIPDLIRALKEDKYHPAVKRNILKLFQTMPIRDAYQSELFDLCLHFIGNISEPLAIRAFSITVANSISLNYPELQQELDLILNEIALQGDSNPSIKARIKQVKKTRNKPNLRR
ncbi:MAG: hypothetical protein AB7O73_15975 [Bacteroidia bacterium]